MQLAATSKGKQTNKQKLDSLFVVIGVEIAKTISHWNQDNINNILQRQSHAYIYIYIYMPSVAKKQNITNIYNIYIYIYEIVIY